MLAFVPIFFYGLGVWIVVSVIFGPPISFVIDAIEGWFRHRVAPRWDRWINRPEGLAAALAARRATSRQSSIASPDPRAGSSTTP